MNRKDREFMSELEDKLLAAAQQAHDISGLRSNGELIGNLADSLLNMLEDVVAKRKEEEKQ